MSDAFGAPLCNDSPYVALLSSGVHSDPLSNRRKFLYYKYGKYAAIALSLVLFGIVLVMTNVFIANSSAVLEQNAALDGDVFVKYRNHFENFAKTYGKAYANADEREKRLGIFAQNLLAIQLHNAQDHDYKMGVNQFADLTNEEFKSFYVKGYKPQEHSTPLKSHNRSLQGIEKQNIPLKVDWRTTKCVTPVKNQMHCGSCWAFSTTGAVEGAYCIKHGTLTSLSEQQLVDCSFDLGNEGCNGGEMDRAFSYLIKSHGACAEAAYPYTGHETKCHKCQRVIDVEGFEDVPPKDSDALAAAISIGPVSVAIEADQMAFQFYKSGVFNAKCGTELDHAVLAVGYGTAAKGGDYWIVKNSWGADWGLDGYILMARNVTSPSGQCGILMGASYPVIA